MTFVVIDKRHRDSQTEPGVRLPTRAEVLEATTGARAVNCDYVIGDTCSVAEPGLGRGDIHHLVVLRPHIGASRQHHKATTECFVRLVRRERAAISRSVPSAATTLYCRTRAGEWRRRVRHREDGQDQQPRVRGHHLTVDSFFEALITEVPLAGVTG
ncbi:hypothetical protein ACIBO6_02145 [Streptomyces luteogriseus]|uniref:hypothetical protein n=1 Tax=Streptomyces luteogriseus TaxID=68233 RepID=UPI0037B8146A